VSGFGRRFPGCEQRAQFGDIDDIIANPVGPTSVESEVPMSVPAFGENVLGLA
jgi:hypothetical protein